MYKFIDRLPPRLYSRNLGLTPHSMGIAVQFSQGQLRDAVGISVETFRHWKRVLPPFAERKRYARQFSGGDLLAAGVLHRLTEHCGIRVGFLPEISVAVVAICNASSWAALDGKYLVVDVQRRTCRVVKGTREITDQGPVIICQVGPILDRMRRALAHSHPEAAQSQLRFPPTIVNDTRRLRRRA